MRSPTTSGTVRARMKFATHSVPMAYVIVGLIYVGLRLAAFLPASPRTFPDTGTYLHTAGAPLLSGEFFLGWRPWTVPLMYKLLPDSNSARVAGQLVLSVACWLTLAAVVAWCLGRLRLVGFSLVLAFSLGVWITQWDSVVLSESLAVSLTALTLAAWLALVRAPNRWTIGAVLATTLVWAFTRDTNAFVTLLAVPFVLAWAAVPGRPRWRIALSLGLVAISTGSLLSASYSSGSWGRWEQPLLHVIGTRVLTNGGEFRYFRANGMPIPSPLLASAGNRLGVGGLRRGSPLSTDPSLYPLRRWVRAHGRQTLAAFLLTHPYRAFAPVIRDSGRLLDTKPLVGYRATGTRPLLPAAVADVLYPPSVAGVFAWLGLAAIACAYQAVRRNVTSVWLVPAVTLLIQFPYAAILWNSDAAEIPRHALLVGLMTRLSLLLLSIFAVEAVLRLDRAGAEPGAISVS